MITNPISKTYKATGSYVIALDPLGMTGLTVQTIITGTATYQIGGTLSPPYDLPTYSGSTTGAFIKGTVPINFTEGFTFPIFASGSTSQTEFFQASLTGLLIKVTNLPAGSSLQVIIQQMTSISR